jgi:23S rRNA (uracil1939-C5)-methyltransferase
LEPPLEEELDGLIFQIHGFFQVNTEAALLLYKKVREYAAMTKNETLIDIYCGVGSMTLFVGRDAKQALGIEQNPASVKAARKNANRNGLSNIKFINADASTWETNFPKPDCIIVDPPRKGLSKETIKKITELKPNRIIYVSCDPATLARDLKTITGYTPVNICAIDMFPRTSNI